MFAVGFNLVFPFLRALWWRATLRIIRKKARRLLPPGFFAFQCNLIFEAIENVTQEKTLTDEQKNWLEP
jgi:hypothetical protein